MGWIRVVELFERPVRAKIKVWITILEFGCKINE